MKSIRNVLTSLFVLGGLVAMSSLLHAQEISSSVQTAAPDSVVQATAEAQGLSLVSPSNLPDAGTFWVVDTNGVSAPWPCPPPNTNLPVYAINDNGQFLVDMTGGKVSTSGQPVQNAMAALAISVENLISQIQDSLTSRTLTQATSNFNPTPTFTYPTNAILKWYLQIGNPAFSSLLSLAPNGTLYVPVSATPEGGGYLLSINTSIVNVSDPNYPLPDDFENWLFVNDYGEDSYFTPSIATDGTVYTFYNDGSGNTSLLALSPTNSILWSLSANSYQSFQTISIGNDGTVYAPVSSMFFALTNAPGLEYNFTNAGGSVFSLTNVAIKWVYDGGNTYPSLFVNSAPFTGQDGTPYIFDSYSSNILYAFSATNGALSWRTSGFLTADWTGVTPAIGSDGTIYLAAGTNFCAVNPKSAVTNGIMGYKWKYTNGLVGYFDYSPIIGADGTIYVEYWPYYTNSILYAIDPNSGVPKWQESVGTGITYYGHYFKHGSLAIGADGEIYMADKDGILYSFDSNGNTNWSYSTGAQALSSPLIGPDGTLYVESIDEDHATCYVYAFSTPSPVACSAWPEDSRNARRTASVATASVSMPMMLTNGLQFSLTGISNMPVCPCASSDLVTWTNIGQTVLTGGKTNFVDIGSSNYPYRFYRAFPQ
jgi:outer membrane protein assembly factor BamB